MGEKSDYPNSFWDCIYFNVEIMNLMVTSKCSVSYNDVHVVDLVFRRLKCKVHVVSQTVISDALTIKHTYIACRIVKLTLTVQSSPLQTSYFLI